MSTDFHDLLEKYRVDAVLISHLPNVRWLCGFTGSRGMVVLRRDDVCFLSDTRYTDQARTEVTHAGVFTQEGAFQDIVAREDLFCDITRILYQGDHLLVSDFEEWQRCFPGIEWVGSERLLDEFVAQKTSEELRLMRQAQGISDRVFTRILGSVVPGVSECDLVAEITYQHLLLGAEKMSFDPIVLSGPRASLPHGRASDRCVKRGELLLLDFGCFVGGYASDMTRTIAVGQPPAAQREAYNVVLEAQTRALDYLCAGHTTCEIDAVARSVIDDAGYGDCFVHSLGHGIGLEVHEWPRLSRHTNDTLPANVAVTIEPGIYVSGQFGIRIEDTVVVGPDACERLGTSPRALLVV